MAPASHLIGFVVAVGVITLSPGPGVLLVINRALSAGRSTALAAATGNATGVYVQVLAVALGIGAVLEQSTAAFTVIRYVGAAYLVFLGVQAIRHRREVGKETGLRTGPVGRLRALREGFVVGATNPKSIAFFVATLPQFIDPGAGRITVQLLVLGTVCALIGLVVESGWALAAATARSWLARSPRGFELVGGAGGVAMIGFGTLLAVTAIRP